MPPPFSQASATLFVERTHALIRTLRHLAVSLCWLVAAPGVASADARTVDLHVFWRVGCAHCERLLDFVDRVAARSPEVQVHRYEVSRDRANLRLMLRAAEALGAEAGSVPFTVIGNRVWTGYLDDATTGREIQARIDACLATPCPDAVGALARGTAAPAQRPQPATRAQLPERLNVPLFGELRTAQLSLPVLTVVLAAADGFNPCAMWVLVFLLGLLAGMKDRARMWILGSAFIAASAFVYLLILSAWLNVLLFVGAIIWVRVAIGVLAVAGGVGYLRAFATNADMTCEVTAPEQRQRVFARLKALALERNFVVALTGIVLLAFAVNAVEFLCSAGIPAVFTQMLALAQLTAWQYAAYLLLYVVIFMLDDLVVLFVALKTLEVSGLTTRYARWSNLVGGAVLLALGVALIFRPAWLGAA